MKIYIYTDEDLHMGLKYEQTAKIIACHITE